MGAVALGATLLAFAAATAVMAWAGRRRGLFQRKIPLALALLAFAPALLVLSGWAVAFELPFVRFARPWLTLPAAVIVGWIAVRLLRLSPRTPRFRRLLIELWSSAAALAAALAASGLEAGLPLDRLTVIVAIDRSRSIDLVPGAQSRIASELRVAELGMREDDRIAVVAFGATAAVEDPARPRTRLPSPQKADVARDGTDLGLAIRQALAEVPPDSAARIALISDGVATRGDAVRASLAATALGVPIDIVPLDQGEVPSVRVNGVRPGIIRTDIHASGGDPGRVDRLGPRVPLGRGGEPDEPGGDPHRINGARRSRRRGARRGAGGGSGGDEGRLVHD